MSMKAPSSPPPPPPPSKYERYIEEITEDIGEVIQQFGCQPILFVGSGLGKRYINTPSWDELLSYLADSCNKIEKSIGYYKQAFKSPLAIGEEFAKVYQEWAWTSGHNEFPKSMFGSNIGPQSYIKYQIAHHIATLTPDKLEKLLEGDFGGEVAALRRIKPHAIITTNYDKMLELLFPDHHPIVGQHILKGQQLAVGEIYKIHGCVSDHDSIVFTQTDYDEFAKKKKFLSAKLLTFFNGHPLIFIGYSATDPNIRSILSDIDEALPEKGGVIPNVYILQWNSAIGEESSPAREKVIATEEDRSVRVKLIEAADFSWVFDAFAANPSLNDVNPKILRALIARSYEMVRHDIPKMKVHADFKLLTDSVVSSSTFAKLFGIANISDFSALAAHHPLSATQLGKCLGGNGWRAANILIDKLTDQTGVNIKSSDNRYHRKEQVNKAPFHKYSQDALALLEKVRDDQPYDLQI